MLRTIFLLAFIFTCSSVAISQICSVGEEPDINNPGACLPCQAGTFNDIPGEMCKPCLVGRISQDGAQSCVLCDPGTTSSADNTTCIPCQAGTFNAERGGICQPCAEGFTSQEGAIECFPAPQIPTITFWGILILGLIMSIVGGLYLYRKEKLLSIRE